MAWDVDSINGGNSSERRKAQSDFE